MAHLFAYEPGKVIIQQVTGWDQVYKDIKAALSAFNYPIENGGAGNICAIYGKCNRDHGSFDSEQEGWPRYKSHWTKDDYYIVARNEGYSGDHSEVCALSKLQRGIIKDIYLFTERAPCENCRHYMNGFGALAHGHNICVQFFESYTDSGTIYDYVSDRYYTPQSGAEVRDNLSHIRDIFKK